MGELTSSNADIYFSGDDYIKLVGDIKTGLIEDSDTKLFEGIEKAKSGMSEYWTGKGAEAMREYLDYVYGIAHNRLDTLKAMIDNSLANIGGKMEIIDNNTANAIKAKMNE